MLASSPALARPAAKHVSTSSEAHAASAARPSPQRSQAPTLYSGSEPLAAGPCTLPHLHFNSKPRSRRARVWRCQGIRAALSLHICLPTPPGILDDVSRVAQSNIVLLLLCHAHAVVCRLTLCVEAVDCRVGRPSTVEPVYVCVGRVRVPPSSPRPNTALAMPLFRSACARACVFLVLALLSMHTVRDQARSLSPSIPPSPSLPLSLPLSLSRIYSTLSPSPASPPPSPSRPLTMARISRSMCNRWLPPFPTVVPTDIMTQISCKKSVSKTAYQLQAPAHSIII
jgi:hypothetical protein